MLIRPAREAVMVTSCCRLMEVAFENAFVQHQGLRLIVPTAPSVYPAVLQSISYCPWCGKEIEITESL